MNKFAIAGIAALAAHASQTSGGGDVRTVRLLSRLPRPLARKTGPHEVRLRRKGQSLQPTQAVQDGLGPPEVDPHHLGHEPAPSDRASPRSRIDQ